MAEALSVDKEKKDFFNASSYENNPDIEQAWASRTVDHMEVHFNLITSINPMMLNLTPYDEEIYSSFREEFPDLKLDVLEEGDLKSDENKQKWRNFCEKWKDKIEDALFGTLVRIDCTKPYSEENTIFDSEIPYTGCSDILDENPPYEYIKVVQRTIAR